MQNAIAVLGASSDIGVYLLHHCVKSWLLDTGGRHPVDTQIHADPAIAQKLEAGEVDVALMEWWDGRADYVAKLWRREELVAIVPPGHPWAALPCVEPELLKKAAILGGEPGSGTGRLLASYLGSQGLPGCHAARQHGGGQAMGARRAQGVAGAHRDRRARMSRRLAGRHPARRRAA